MQQIRAHGAEAYPHECCGALLGIDGAGGRVVKKLFPLENRHEDSPGNRFLLTAEDVRRAERVAAESALELVGWYHSHPDHPARPSEYDREHAWPWYSYVIVRVDAGMPQELTSWRLADDRSGFLPEEAETGQRTPAAAESGLYGSRG